MGVKTCTLSALLLLFVNQVAWAQDSSRLIAENLYAPEFVLKYGREIQLSEEQGRAISATLNDYQRHIGELRFQLREVTRNLESLISRDTQNVDENQALAYLGHMLNIEGSIKQSQFSLLIRTKNMLRPDQQERLRQIRRQNMQK